MTARTTPFADRSEAGRELATGLASYAGRDDVVVLALPRGGVPVAAPVARALRAPLDVLVVRKIGVPGQPEVAMGAIAGVGDAVELVRNERVLSMVSVREQDFQAVQDRELHELRRREAAYREGRPAVVVRDKLVVLVDDGLATGSTMLAAVAAVRRQDPARLVVAVPVGAADTCEALRREADEVVCSWTPEPFYAVGQGYRDFSATEDHEVTAALQETAGAHERS
jgi:putative phosphoribosyl transferase